MQPEPNEREKFSKIAGASAIAFLLSTGLVLALFQTRDSVIELARRGWSLVYRRRRVLNNTLPTADRSPSQSSYPRPNCHSRRSSQTKQSCRRCVRDCVTGSQVAILTSRLFKSTKEMRRCQCQLLRSVRSSNINANGRFQKRAVEPSQQQWCPLRRTGERSASPLLLTQISAARRSWQKSGTAVQVQGKGKCVGQTQVYGQLLRRTNRSSTLFYLGIILAEKSRFGTTHRHSTG